MSSVIWALAAVVLRTKMGIKSKGDYSTSSNAEGMLIHQQRLETVSANSQRNEDRQHSAFPIIVLSENIGSSQRKVQKQL